MPSWAQHRDGSRLLAVLTQACWTRLLFKHGLDSKDFGFAHDPSQTDGATCEGIVLQVVNQPPVADQRPVRPPPSVGRRIEVRQVTRSLRSLNVMATVQYGSHHDDGKCAGNRRSIACCVNRFVNQRA
jgi:hypothetical protein